MLDLETKGEQLRHHIITALFETPELLSYVVEGITHGMRLAHQRDIETMNWQNQALAVAVSMIKPERLSASNKQSYNAMMERALSKCWPMPTTQDTSVLLKEKE